MAGAELRASNQLLEVNSSRGDSVLILHPPPPLIFDKIALLIRSTAKNQNLYVRKKKILFMLLNFQYGTIRYF